MHVTTSESSLPLADAKKLTTAARLARNQTRNFMRINAILLRRRRLNEYS